MKRILLLVTLFTLSSASFGQYYYKYSIGNPGNLNNDNGFETSSPSGWKSVFPGNNSPSNPTWSVNQGIPFSFNFNGALVTQYKISNTGVLTFTTGATAVPGKANTALPSASIPDASVCVWGAHKLSRHDKINTKTFGTAPNRQHWITFRIYTNVIKEIYWSIVLEESSNYIYLVDVRKTGGDDGITAGIQINSTNAASVNGSPDLKQVTDMNPSYTDNVHYKFIPSIQPAYDAELTSLASLPYAAPANTSITGTITNVGSNPISDMTISYDIGSGPVNHVLTGLNIATNETYNFSHSTPLAVAPGATYNIDVTVTLPGETNTTDNTKNFDLLGLTFSPKKITVGEERTGTWCGFCPVGAVALSNMESKNDFIGIAIHSDEMEIPAYKENIERYIQGHHPSGGVDRVETIYPRSGDFLMAYDARKNTVVPCDVKNVTLNVVGNNISVSADSEWYGTIKGDYRLSCVIVEDNLIKGPQLNSFATGERGGPGGRSDNNGPLAFPSGINNDFDFYNAEKRVNSEKFLGYDHVAVSLSSNNVLGTPNSLPLSEVPLGVHSFVFPDLPLSVISDINNAQAVVMVVNSATGEILNAAKSGMTTAINDIENDKFQVNIYPNPTHGTTSITFELNKQNNVNLEVYNVMGTLVYTKGQSILNAGTQNITFDGTNLSNGIYFVNLIIDNNVITKKVSLIK